MILVDRSGAQPKVLLGKRHAGLKFMAGKFVFPGGRMEPGDRKMPVASDLDPHAGARLMRGSTARASDKARALALAAIRETFEETGLLLGKRVDDVPPVPEGPWKAFADAKVLPDLAQLHFIVRAITPPRRPRRFDARFFAADASAIAHRIDGKVGPDSELVELVWLPIAEAKKPRPADHHAGRARRTAGARREGLRPRPAVAVLPHAAQALRARQNCDVSWRDERIFVLSLTFDYLRQVFANHICGMPNY